MKKLLIYLTVLFSAFLFTNKVSALTYNKDIQAFDKSLSAFTSLELKDSDIQNYISTLGLNSSYNGYLFLIYPTYSKYEYKLFIFPKEVAEDGSLMLRMSSSSYYVGSLITADGSTPFTAYYKNNVSNKYITSGAAKTITSFNDFTLTSGINSFKNGNGIYTNSNLENINSPIWYFSNVDIYNEYTDSWLSANATSAPNEFTINTYDTEFGGHWFGVNYIQGQQNNTVDFYIQDSGILTISAAKGYEIEKIYYDEALTQEANLNDIVETDTNLYVTWKSKIEISKQIATDLSGNDVITISYDFSKIYNENYSYWISNDGTNYVDITDRLNSNHKYASGVYFAGNYFARVQDENNETISVHYINIDYYRITPTTEIGKDIDENGNIKPYVILDYSAYREIKNNIICEYSIDNGNTWIDITKELDINMKYKLYINVGDKVTSRVRTNGNTILPGETGGSNYDVTEDFYNDILINEEKDVLEEFKDLLTNKNDNIFIKFKEVWEAFKDSVLFNYIYILIVGSLIILIIKSAKRN